MRISAVVPQTTTSRRRGMVVTVEMLFIVPILLILLAGIIEFYMLATVRQELLTASRVGARVAARGNRHDKTLVRAQVQKAVQRVLGYGSLGNSAQVQVIWPDDVNQSVHNNDNQNLNNNNYSNSGNNNSNYNRRLDHDDDWVQVSVQTSITQVIPDLLGWAGFTLGGKNIVAATTMNLE